MLRANSRARSGAGVQGGCISIERRRQREAGTAAPPAQNRGPHLLLHAPLHEKKNVPIISVYFLSKHPLPCLCAGWQKRKGNQETERGASSVVTFCSDARRFRSCGAVAQRRAGDMQWHINKPLSCSAFCLICHWLFLSEFHSLLLRAFSEGSYTACVCLTWAHCQL